MAVAQADSGTRFVEGSSVTTVDLDTFTIGAGANFIVAWLHTASISVPTMKLDPLGSLQNFTNGGNTNVGGARVQFFYLVNPAPGNKKIRGEWTTATDVVLGAVALSGVDTATPFVLADTQTASGTLAVDPETETLTMTSDANGATLVGFTAVSSSIAPAGSQTELYRDNNLLRTAQLTIAFGGTSNAHTANMNTVGTNWVGRGIHISAASAAPADLPGAFIMS